MVKINFVEATQEDLQALKRYIKAGLITIKKITIYKHHINIITEG